MSNKVLCFYESKSAGTNIISMLQCLKSSLGRGILLRNVSKQRVWDLCRPASASASASVSVSGSGSVRASEKTANGESLIRMIAARNSKESVCVSARSESAPSVVDAARMNTRRFADSQDIESIRASVIRSGRKFEDALFPLGDEILPDRLHQANVQWVRIADVCRMRQLPRPCIFNSKPYIEDVTQNLLDNCWLLAYLARFVLHPELMSRVLPGDNCFLEDSGAFHCRFWRNGDWVDVVIDDRIPVICEDDKFQFQWVCASSSQEYVFWATLIEKAFAKFIGGYHLFSKVSEQIGAELLTGGISSGLFFATDFDTPARLYQKLKLLDQRPSLIIADTPNYMTSEQLSGLLPDHSFTVTQLAVVSWLGAYDNYLIASRNPHGLRNCHVWQGAWNDYSVEWADIDPFVVYNLLVTRRASPVEFWMNLADWRTRFVRVITCGTGPETMLVDTMEVHDAFRQFVVAGAGQKGSTTVCYFNVPAYDVRAEADNVALMLFERLQPAASFGHVIRTMQFRIYRLPSDNDNDSDEGKGSKAGPVLFMQQWSSDYSKLIGDSAVLRLEPGAYKIEFEFNNPAICAVATLRLFIKQPPGLNAVQDTCIANVNAINLDHPTISVPRFLVASTLFNALQKSAELERLLTKQLCRQITELLLLEQPHCSMDFAFDEIYKFYEIAKQFFNTADHHGYFSANNLAQFSFLSQPLPVSSLLKLLHHQSDKDGRIDRSALEVSSALLVLLMLAKS